MSDPQEVATPSDPHSAEAEEREAWAAFVAGHASRDAEVAELRAEKERWHDAALIGLAQESAAQAEVAELRARVDPQADSLRQKLWEYLGTETYLCDRDASAWGYGTMSLDDFRLAREDDEFMDSVLDLLDSPMKGDNR